MDDLDALLADLQSSVPCSSHFIFPPNSSEEQQNSYNGTPGYGSLRTKTNSPQDSSSKRKIMTQSQYTSSSGDDCRSNNTSALTNHSYQYQHQEISGRAQNINYISDESVAPLQQNGNLSELDSLLQDLSNGRYNTDFGNKRDIKHIYANPSSKVNTYSNFSSSSLENRPAVDTLLNEMDNTSSFAVQNGVSIDQKALTPSHEVTITVRERSTGKLDTPLESDIFESTDIYASSATKELDELMASLSDFKISSSSHHHQTVIDYAKPNKGISHITQTLSETSTGGEEGQGDQLVSMLGNLQENMSRQGVNTVQKGCCNACEKPIVGQVISALGKTWHPEHFTCNHCSQELGTRNFFERDGYAYCEVDYHNLFSPRCAYCNGAILDKCVTALDKTWHTEHFFCAQCGQQFGEDGFHEREGKPYCRNDYFEMFAPKCNGCNRAIMENYISALNSQWHPDCFVCRDCRQPFQGGSFFDHDGLPYCEMHYHAKRGSLCAGCSKPITGRCITAMFKKFHPEHFVCAFCLKQLNKGTFKEQNDKPYCHTCFEKIFG